MVCSKLLLSLLSTVLLEGLIPHSNAQVSDGLALLASSPFRMILQPTTSELDYEALRFIEDAIPSLLLAKQSEEPDFADMEMVIQQAEFLASQNATRLRFFVLATTLAQDGAPSGSPVTQSDLNEFISDTLSDSSDIISMFQASGIPGLTDVTLVVVQEITPTSPVTPETPPTNKITTLDIVLIVVSGAIFLGIAYMVIQHIKDRGYIENQRLIAFNSSPVPSPTNPDGGTSQAEDTPGRDYKQSTESENAPSTPSTTNSVADADFNDDQEAPGTPERRPVRVTNVAAVPPQEVTSTITASEVEGRPVIPEQFENNWFHEDRSKTSSTKTVNDEEPANTSSSSETDSSEDVFQIDIEALGADEARSKASSSSSAISEWMKTIRVIPTPSTTNKTDRTQSTIGSHEKSSEGESSEPSVDHSSDDLSSLECASLEQSLQSSTVEDKTVETGKGEV